MSHVDGVPSDGFHEEAVHKTYIFYVIHCIIKSPLRFAGEQSKEQFILLFKLLISAIGHLSN